MRFASNLAMIQRIQRPYFAKQCQYTFTRKTSSSSSLQPSKQLHQLLHHSSNLTHLQQTQCFMLKTSLDQDDTLLSQLIHTSASLNFPSFAFSIFTSHSTHRRLTICVHNNAINALSSSNPLHSVSLFNSVRFLGISPDSYTVPFVLKAVVALRDGGLGKQVHCVAVVTGLDCYGSVGTAVLKMYCCENDVESARKVFDGFGLVRDGLMWNGMIVGYVRVGDMVNARKVFECMPKKNVFSWTALISGYTQTHNPTESIKLFRRMQLENVQPDEIAILAVLSACADLGALHLGEWIHNWTTMISGLASHGLGKEALNVFSCMEKEGRVKPNEVTFIAILSACSHSGLVELGRYYFMSMRSKYGIEPKVEHYGCMIDLLGRGGHLEEAKELVGRMPFEASAAIWGSLLAASTRCGDAELAAEALRHLIVLEPHNSANYLLLSNTYASLGRWSEARNVRNVMRDTGVEKVPGVSFIEVNNRVYEFIAGDKSNIYFVDISDVLHCLDGQLKIEDH